MTTDFSCFDKFDISEGADTPIRMNICDREGNVTTEWVEYVSTYSDRFQRAIVANSRHALINATLNPDIDIDKAGVDAELSLLATCITGWSFDIPCTHENAVLFLTKARHIFNEMNKRTNEHARFFGRAPTNSKNTSN